jgi:catechol 2,3-dioxygenase-like lactoylglutathione lyase family enzyme
MGGWNAAEEQSACSRNRFQTRLSNNYRINLRRLSCDYEFSAETHCIVSLFALVSRMSVQVYGCNHVAIEVDDIDRAVSFYQDVFDLEKLKGGEGDAFFKLGEHQFLAIFEVEKVQPVNLRHFGLIVRDERQLAEVRKKITEKYRLKLEPPFRCDFRDPWGNRIQVVDLHDESLVWLMPYREVQKTGIKFVSAL